MKHTVMIPTALLSSLLALPAIASATDHTPQTLDANEAAAEQQLMIEPYGHIPLQQAEADQEALMRAEQAQAAMRMDQSQQQITLNNGDTMAVEAGLEGEQDEEQEDEQVEEQVEEAQPDELEVNEQLATDDASIDDTQQGTQATATAGSVTGHALNFNHESKDYRRLMQSEATNGQIDPANSEAITLQEKVVDKRGELEATQPGQVELQENRRIVTP